MHVENQPLGRQQRQRPLQRKRPEATKKLRPKPTNPTTLLPTENENEKNNNEKEQSEDQFKKK
jgi:hypothetical protein